MADRYWVGGTGTWNTTSTTNWSATSGGGSGASVPTAADNVIFNAASGTGSYTVTLTGALLCNDFTVSAGAPTFITGTTPTLSISGSYTLASTTVWTTNVAITFAATTTGKTITTNGVTIGATTNSITFNGAGGGWSLGSSLTTNIGATISLLAGSFSTANYNITSGVFSTSGTQVRSLSLGSSTLTLNAVTFGTTVINGYTFNNGTSSWIWFVSSTTNFTFNAGTSTITSSSGGRFLGGGLTYYNISYIRPSATSASYTIHNANSFNSITVLQSSFGVCNLYFDSNQTIGTLTVNNGSTDPTKRVLIGAFPNAVTLTVGSVALYSTDFLNIIAAGASISGGSWSGTSIGNATGNSNITFTAAKTVYLVSTTASVTWYSTIWSTSPTLGTADASAFPLPQDTITITNLSTTTTITTATAGWVLGTIDASLRTNPISLPQYSSNSSLICGDMYLGIGVTLGGANNYGGYIFMGSKSPQYIRQNGATVQSGLGINKAQGTILTFLDDYTCNLGSGILQSGVMDIADRTITFGYTFTTNEPENTQGVAMPIKEIRFGSTGKIVISYYTTLGSLTGILSPVSLVLTGTYPVLYYKHIFTGTVGVTTVQTNGTSATTINENSYFNFVIDGANVNYSFYGSSRSINFVNSNGYFGTTFGLSIYGSLALVSGMTFLASTSSINFLGSSSGISTINTANIDFDSPININAPTYTYKLLDSLKQPTTRAFTLTNGTLDLNGKTLTVGTSFTTATGTKNVTFNGGSIVCPASTTTAFNNAAGANFTTSAGTYPGTISMTGSTAKTFAGGGGNYAATLNQNGAGALTITGSNKFADITTTVRPSTITFTGGTTTTLSKFSLSGTAGNLVTIGSNNTTSFTITKSSGNIACDYLSISRSTATGGATWYAGSHSTNGGNNSGWTFSSFSTPIKGQFFNLFG